ncbi:hypothetical protein FSP39_023785 [Pinctada imbricata]|uniref:Solute carrier family 28 member 3 n=1 Tax=Pinctada imbricata TaxID=66713 RepID=A0AA88Y6J1_PINIB|nr:hypothetical protein FSP39_023785 [Pinctada imbricata]
MSEVIKKTDKMNGNKEERVDLDIDTQIYIEDTKQGKDSQEISSMEMEVKGSTNEKPEVEVNADEKHDLVEDTQYFPHVSNLLHRISLLRILILIRLKLDSCFKAHKTSIKRSVYVLLLLGYFAYLTYAMIYRFGDEGSHRLLILTVIVVVGFIFHKVKKKYGGVIRKHLQNSYSKHRPSNKSVFFIKMILMCFVILSILLYLIFGVFIREPYNIVPAAGLVVFVLTMFFLSRDPQKVSWRPVCWGLLLQFIFAIIVLRTSWGYDAFDWLGKRVLEYLAHTDYGASFMFGAGFAEHYFAFKGETTTLVKPFFDQMSLSELHTIMTNGFATAAGSTLVIYALYGAPANHLISASVMSAPAALAISKLFWPEIKREHKKLQDTIKSYRIKREGHNLIDAASAGAIAAIPVVAYIFASVIVFFSLLDFLNTTLAWMGERVGLSPPDYPVLTFQLICSYLFWPLVFLMGVEAPDCTTVARMVGIKTFINEFLAYEDLGKVIRNSETFKSFNGSWHYDNSYNLVLENTNITLYGGVITKRSEVIATYALCGFANITALGIMIGALTAVAPSRKKDIVKVSTRALIAGSMACFITACIAGRHLNHN